MVLLMYTNIAYSRQTNKLVWWPVKWNNNENFLFIHEVQDVIKKNKFLQDLCVLANDGTPCQRHWHQILCLPQQTASRPIIICPIVHPVLKLPRVHFHLIRPPYLWSLQWSIVFRVDLTGPSSVCTCNVFSIFRTMFIVPAHLILLSQKLIQKSLQIIVIVINLFVLFLFKF